MATETTKLKDRDKVIYLVAFAAIVVALYFLFRKHGAGAASTATAPATSGAPGDQSTQPTMFWPPTALTLPDIPPTSVNVNFTPATNTNQPTGYVPLFGFIGYGGQWA